ncbi:MAG: hypothetical protein U0163_17000 [Gemmatimonadaceae bacterium]
MLMALVQHTPVKLTAYGRNLWQAVRHLLCAESEFSGVPWPAATGPGGSVSRHADGRMLTLDASPSVAADVPLRYAGRCPADGGSRGRRSASKARR